MAKEPLHPWITLLAPRLYFLKFPQESSQKEALEFFASAEAGLRELDETVSIVVDMRAVSVDKVGAAERQHYAGFERKVADLQRVKLDVVALIIGDEVHRRFITAVHWLAPPSYRFQIFDDALTGIEWARSKMGGADRVD